MMQKIDALISRIEAYIRNSGDNVSIGELCTQLAASEEEIKKAVSILLNKDILFEHKDHTLTLNNPNLVIDRPDLVRLS